MCGFTETKCCRLLYNEKWFGRIPWARNDAICYTTSMKNHQPITLHFCARVDTIKTQMIILLPAEVSGKLSSRGQVSVTGKVKGYKFATVLEPDGRWSHWIRVTEDLVRKARLRTGDTVEIEMTTTDVWPEPNLPSDITDALVVASSKVQEKWGDITPMARWEWVRWVNATGSVETRARRIVKTISKLDGTHRRPCCFNLAACTDPELSKSGRLLEVDTK